MWKIFNFEFLGVITKYFPGKLSSMPNTNIKSGKYCFILDMDENSKLLS